MLAAGSAIAAHLAADDPDGARRGVTEAMRQWSQTGFYVQHWEAMVFEPEVDLYLGDGAAAYDRFARDLPALERSLLSGVQFIRGMTASGRGRFAIAAVEARPGERRARIAEARRMARKLARERCEVAQALAASLAACADNAAGDHAAAGAALRVALEHAEAASYGLLVAPARYRLGELLGGDEGSALVRGAVEELTAQGVRDPARWVAMMLPGRWVGPPAARA